MSEEEMILENEKGLDIIEKDLALGRDEDNDMTSYDDGVYSFNLLTNRANELNLNPPYILKVSKSTQYIPNYGRIMIQGYIYLIDVNNKTLKSGLITFKDIYEGDPRYSYIMKHRKKS